MINLKKYEYQVLSEGNHQAWEELVSQIQKLETTLSNIHGVIHQRPVPLTSLKDVTHQKPKYLILSNESRVPIKHWSDLFRYFLDKAVNKGYYEIYGIPENLITESGYELPDGRFVNVNRGASEDVKCVIQLLHFYHKDPSSYSVILGG